MTTPDRKTGNPLLKATHMFFALKDGRAYAAAWDVPEWKVAKEFYRDNAGADIRRVEARTPECDKLIEDMKL